SACVEWDFGEGPQLGRAQFAIEVLLQANGVVFLAVDLRLEALGSCQAEASQAIPAVMLGKTQCARSVIVRRNGVAECGRQDVATLVAARGVSLPAISCRCFRHVPLPPSAMLKPRSDAHLSRLAAREGAIRHPRAGDANGLLVRWTRY